MLNELDKKIYDRAIGQAVQAVSIAKPINMQRESVYPIWRNAVHEILARNGKCSCRSGGPKPCFMNLSKRDQIYIFNNGGAYGFDGFITILEEGRKGYTTMIKKKDFPQE